MNKYIDDSIYTEIYERSLDITYWMSQLLLDTSGELILLINQEDFDDLKKEIEGRGIFLIEDSENKLNNKMIFPNGIKFDVYIVDIQRFRVLNKVN